MNYDCIEFKAFRESPRHLRDFEELHHTLLGVRVEDGQCIAVFPNGEFSFPAELREELRTLLGKTVAILRLNGYHIREADDV